MKKRRTPFRDGLNLQTPGLVTHIHALAPKFCEINLASFKATKNELYLWRALANALIYGFTPPVEVRDYMLRCAAALCDSKTNTPEAIAAALNLTARKIASHTAASASMDVALAHSIKMPGFETEEKAAESLDVDVRTVQRLKKQAHDHSVAVSPPPKKPV